MVARMMREGKSVEEIAQYFGISKKRAQSLIREVEFQEKGEGENMDSEAWKGYQKIRERENQMIEKIKQARMNIQEIIETFNVAPQYAYHLFLEAFNVFDGYDLLPEEQDILKALERYPGAKIGYLRNYQNLSRCFTLEFDGKMHYIRLYNLGEWSKKVLELINGRVIKSSWEREKENEKNKSSLRAQGAKNIHK